MGIRGNKQRVKRNIPDAYFYFSGEIEAWLGEDEDDASRRIAGLYSAIRDNVRLVVIDLDEKDDPQVIFETLNARGTPLLSADLVKNSLLNEVRADGGAPGEAYEAYWRQFDSHAAFWREQVGRGHAQRARIETFLQHTLTLLSAVVSASHLYNAYRDYARSANAGTAIDRLRKLKTYGDIFKRLQRTHENPRIDTFLYRLRTLDVVTAWPLILALFGRLEDDRKTEGVLVDLESYLVRRMVCRLSTRGYGEIFARLTASLNDDPGDPLATVRASLLQGTAEVDRWPTDEEFRQAWVSNPLYENLTRPRLRMLLEAMEEALRSEFAETQAVPKNLTIEHVMPQGWREHWPLSDATVADARDRDIHTIGNLTLLNTKLNTRQSNRPWIDKNEPTEGKRQALSNHSVLCLNKALCQFDDWNEERIKQRSADLFDLAVKIWPRAAS